MHEHNPQMARDNNFYQPFIAQNTESNGDQIRTNENTSITHNKIDLTSGNINKPHAPEIQPKVNETSSEKTKDIVSQKLVLEQ